MILSSFTAYLAAQYLLSNELLILSFFLLLLVVSSLADDGDSRFNLGRPQAGILIFSLLFGVFLGLIVKDIISILLVFYLGGASLFLAMGFYGSMMKLDADGIESFLFIKYSVLLLILFFKFVVGCSIFHIFLVISRMLIFGFIWSLCVMRLEGVYLYYSKNKSAFDLTFIGAFKFYNVFFQGLWAPCILSSSSDYELITMPKNRKIETDKAPDARKENPTQSSADQPSRHDRDQKLSSAEKTKSTLIGTNRQ